MHLDQYTIGGTKITSMTDEEFYHFCLENPSLKIERDANGQIVIMSPTGFNTGRINLIILAELSRWSLTSNMGQAVDSDTGFYLPNGAMRNPDGAWVSNERLAKVPMEDLERIPYLVPDFVFELASKSDHPRNLQAKMTEWLENGVRLGWLIDPYKQQTTVYYSGSAPEVLEGFDRVLDGGDVLPGFGLDLGKLRV